MHLLQHLLSFLLLAVCIVSGAVYVPSGGPVYVNPNAEPSPSLLDTNNNEQPDRTTQTVYGFLDFTTTIGNTVMVFSPQSAPPAGKTEKPTEKTTIIETKPVTEKPEVTITPSKTVKPISSVVEVKGPVPEVEKAIFSVVEVIGGESTQTVDLKQGPVLSSKIEIKEGPPVKIKKSSQKQSVIKTEEDKPKKVEIKVDQVKKEPIVLSSIVEVISNDDDKNKVVVDDDRAVEVDGNNIEKTEYDFLNRQPPEIVDENYKVINIKPNSKIHLRPKNDQKKNGPAASAKERGSGSQPTGLVTKLGGTVVKEGITTVHETQVIGTYISGKYAQVLQSSSKILNEKKSPKIAPSPTTRILKTAAPNFAKSRVHLEPTPAGSLQEETALPLEALFHGDKSSNLIRPSRRPGPAVGGPASGKNDYKQRFTNRPRASTTVQDLNDEYDNDDAEVQSNSGFKKFKNRSSSSSKSTSSESTTSSPSGRKYQNTNRRSSNGYKPKSKENSSHDKEDGFTRRGYKPKVQASAADAAGSSSSLYKFKLQRPSGRWQYKTTPKPRITIRRQDGVEQSDQQPAPQFTPAAVTIDDLDTANGKEEEEIDENVADKALNIEPTPSATTLKVQLSTPADFQDVYYEIATIKSPYTFQVGTVRNTRYITVTSTIEKTLQSIEPTLAILPSLTEPLTENILASTQVYDKENNLPLDSSIATLPPITLGTDVETPPLETITETFSTTQMLLKTHILPVIRGGNTTSYTLVQSYHVTRMVTATKTLPPMEVYQFVPSKTLKDFNTKLEEAGSELHLELEFGDDGNQEDDDDERAAVVRAFPPDLDLANIGNDFDLSSVDKTKLEIIRQQKQLQTTPKPTTETPSTTPALSPEQMQQLALLRYLNPAANLPPQLLTSSKPVVKVETVFESHVIPFFNGLSTTFSTISRPVSTVAKTEYEVVTNTVQTPLQPLNPFQQQFTIISTPVVTNTIVTATNSKILKLTFGAKTAYTTLYSTKVMPTVLTTYLTSSVPVAPSAAFPGYFPAPFGGFPGFVG